MSLQVARLGDRCTGHRCWPPRSNDQGSPNVFVNGIQIHRQSDHWIRHQCDDNSHDSVLCSGSASVFANGLAIGRLGDPICCGSQVAGGSPNVFAG